MIDIKSIAGGASVRSRLGLVYRMKGDLDRGEQEFLLALEIYRGLEQLDKIAMVLNNLSNLYRMRDQHTKAVATFRESLKLFERLGQPEGVIAGHFNLAQTYKRMNARSMTRFHLKEAIRHAGAQSDPSSRATAWEMKADLLDFESEQNATDEAQAYRQKALELYGDRSDKQVVILLSEMAMYEA